MYNIKTNLTPVSTSVNSYGDFIITHKYKIDDKEITVVIRNYYVTSSSIDEANESTDITNLPIGERKFRHFYLIGHTITTCVVGDIDVEVKKCKS